MIFLWIRRQWVQSSALESAMQKWCSCWPVRDEKMSSTYQSDGNIMISQVDISIYMIIKQMEIQWPIRWKYDYQTDGNMIFQSDGNIEKETLEELQMFSIVTLYCRLYVSAVNCQECSLSIWMVRTNTKQVITKYSIIRQDQVIACVISMTHFLLHLNLCCWDPPKAKLQYVLLNKEILESLECRIVQRRCQIRGL